MESLPVERAPVVREVGRRSRLTPIMISRLASVIREGNMMTTACEYVGIPYSTYQRWRAKGEDLRSRGVDNALEVDLVRAIEVAISDSEAELVHHWRLAAIAGDWRAAKELLARRFPDRWGAPEKGPEGNKGGTTGDIQEHHIIIEGPDGDKGFKYLNPNQTTLLTGDEGDEDDDFETDLGDGESE